jgi:hypothetical protein
MTTGANPPDMATSRTRRHRGPLRRGTVRVLRIIRRIWWLELLVVGVVVGLLLGGFFKLRDRAVPVTVAQAVADFREQGEAAEPSANETSSIQEEGVYVYATTGSETVDALSGARHPYPAQTTVTVTQEGCGLRTIWRPLEQRTDDGITCVQSDQLLVDRFITSHEFFQKRDRRDFRCEAGTLLMPVRPATGQKWTMHCRSEDTTSVSRGEVIGVEDLDVGGRKVSTVHVRLVSTLRGDSNGTRSADAWLLPSNGLMVRTIARARISARSVLGNVHYAEDYELNLTSLDPRR